MPACLSGLRFCHIGGIPYILRASGFLDCRSSYLSWQASSSWVQRSCRHGYTRHAERKRPSCHILWKKHSYDLNRVGWVVIHWLFLSFSLRVGAYIRLKAMFRAASFDGQFGSSTFICSIFLYCCFTFIWQIKSVLFIKLCILTIFFSTVYTPCSEKNTHFCFLPPTKEEVNVFARIRLSVCLSVCLLARLLKNACMDLDLMLHVDRCRDTEELVNFWTRSGL